MKYSLIIPTSGRVELFLATLKSIEEQSLKDFQLIVTDDSLDLEHRRIIKLETLKLNKSIREVKYVFSRPRLGQSANTNQGLKHSTGEIVSILHSDDIYHPATIQFECIVFNTLPVDIVYHNTKPFLSDRLLSLNPRVNVTLMSPRYLLSHWLHSATALPSGISFKRKLLYEEGFMDENMKFLCDWKLFFNMVKNQLRKNRFLANISEGLVGWRTHGDSTTGKYWKDHFVEHKAFMQDVYESRILQDELFLTDDESFGWLMYGKKYRDLRFEQDRINYLKTR